MAFWNRTAKPKVDDEIEHILNELKAMQPDSKEYVIACRNLAVLCEAKSFKADRLVNMDTLVLAGTNILGILLVLYYEKFDIISKKAFGMIMKTHV